MMKMKTVFNTAAWVLLVMALLPGVGVAGEGVESGVIQAYDGVRLRVDGKEFLLSVKARQQLESVLKAAPVNGLENLMIKFVPRKRSGKDYIESVEIPLNDA